MSTEKRDPSNQNPLSGFRTLDTEYRKKKSPKEVECS